MASTTWSVEVKAEEKSLLKGTSRSSSCFVSRCEHDERTKNPC